MTDPLIFVTAHKINEGELERIVRLSTSFSDVAEAGETGLVAFHFYMDEDQRVITNIQVHHDTASMDAYLPIVAEKIGEALQLSQTLTIDVYGRPGPVLTEVLRRNEEQGVRVRVMPIHLDGFTRTATKDAA